MSNTKFAHVRPLVENGKHYPGGEKVKVKPTKGGLTIAFQRNGDLEVTYNIAKCNDKDNFCRRIGRQVAAGRLKNKGYIVDVQSTDKYAEIIKLILKDMS